MKPEFAPLRLTLVDLFAALLPGIAWLVIAVTLTNLLDLTQGRLPSPIEAASSLIKPTADNTGFPRILALLCAIGLGYAVKPLTNRIAEHIVRWPDIFWSRLRQERNPSTDESDYRFPYRILHADKPYFATLEQLALNVTTCKDLKDTKNLQTQPFSTCKRYLRLQAPSLWEEAEHVEAETRMFGSLFLAAVASVLLALAGIGRLTFRDAVLWIGASLASALIFALAFRAERQREVATVYLNALIAMRLESKAAIGDSDKA